MHMHMHMQSRTCTCTYMAHGSHGFSYCICSELLSREPGTHSPPEAFTEPGTHSGTRLYSALKPGTRPETQGPKIRNPEPGTLHRANFEALGLSTK